MTDIGALPPFVLSRAFKSLSEVIVDVWPEYMRVKLDTMAYYTLVYTNTDGVKKATIYRGDEEEADIFYYDFLASVENLDKPRKEQPDAETNS